TATTINGATARPAFAASSVAIITEVRGRRSTDTQTAPTRAAIAWVSAYPGRCSAISPATTPRKIAGKVGPPRKLPSEIDHGRLLNRSSRKSVDRDSVAACPNSDPNASSPEKRTDVVGSPVDCANAIARPPTASPATIVSTSGLSDTSRFDHLASSITANTA